MSFSLDGHVALVTGSTTGLGKITAQHLATAGAKIVVNYANNKERAARAFDELQATGGQSMLVQADVTSEQDVDRMFSLIESEFGPVDIIVANATPDQPLRPIEEYDWEFYQSMINFFIKSPYLLARRALPAMKKKKWGRFINITSEVYHTSVAPFSGYVAAKGGQIGWSRSMASELAPYGITVNMVSPGWIPVERHEKDSREDKDQYLATIPMRRWGTPKDVAAAVLYYASEEASFVTGQTLCVNGGRSPW
ncbi:MAG: SDR family oxidoreductase [Pirellulales bacterium]|nr:SDR family oxidoreductase [Pirellulales bacterium]